VLSKHVHFTFFSSLEGPELADPITHFTSVRGLGSEVLFLHASRTYQQLPTSSFGESDHEPSILLELLGC